MDIRYHSSKEIPLTSLETQLDMTTLKQLLSNWYNNSEKTEEDRQKILSKIAQYKIPPKSVTAVIKSEFYATGKLGDNLKDNNYAYLSLLTELIKIGFPAEDCYELLKDSLFNNTFMATLSHDSKSLMQFLILISVMLKSGISSKLLFDLIKHEGSTVRNTSHYFSARRDPDCIGKYFLL